MKKLSGISFLALLFVSLFVSVSLADSMMSPPSYIKNISACHKGPERLEVYFVLADEKGSMTVADGRAFLGIYETHSKWNSITHKYESTDELLYSENFLVSNWEFKRARVGMGAFEHEVILYLVGQIPYSSFIHQPTEKYGKVVIRLETYAGRYFESTEEIIF